MLKNETGNGCDVSTETNKKQHTLYPKKGGHKTLERFLSS